MFRYVLGGLMIVAMASVASAGHKAGHSPGGGGGAATLSELNCTTDQIAKFNDVSGAWECAFDEVGGDSFVVVDSSDQIVRHTMIDDNLMSALVAVNVQFFAETVTTVQEFGQNVILRNNFGAGLPIIGYESSNCSGQPNLLTRNDNVVCIDSLCPAPTPLSSPLLNWKESSIIIDPLAASGPNLDARLIFFLDYNQLTPIFLRSVLDDAGNCITDIQESQWVFPITEDQFSDFRVDLHVLFPPPYRICFADDIDCITGP